MPGNLENTAEMSASVSKAACPLIGWVHSSVAVRELDPAVAFFEQAFGFELIFRERSMTRQIASITGVEGLRCDLAQMSHPVTPHILELIAFTAPRPGAATRAPIAPGGGHFAFLVADLRASIARLEVLGAEMIGEITAFGDGPAAYLRVPGDAYIELEQPLDQ